MWTRRRLFGLTLPLLGSVVALAVCAGCGGAPTRLVTVKSGSGSGPVQLEVKNMTDVPINSLFLAKSEEVSGQLDSDSPEGQRIWGGDLLNAAIPMGERVPVSVPSAGRWDCRAVDRDGRYQHVAALKLEAGGRYILELQEGGWRVQ